MNDDYPVVDGLITVEFDMRAPKNVCHVCRGPMSLDGPTDLMDEPDPYQSFEVLRLSCDDPQCHGQIFLTTGGNNSIGIWLGRRGGGR